MSRDDEIIRDALEGMVRQFAYWSDAVGGYWTGGNSALEEAFEVLGWDDPHPAPEARCDEPGCLFRAEDGWPTPAGPRRTCHAHTAYDGWRPPPGWSWDGSAWTDGR